jgi:hypothetical protein
MIEISKTKGIIGYIKIEIYHNNQNIDLDGIEEEFNENLRELEKSEDYYLNEIKK